ncbi:hypothetical protein ABZT17_33660 [Streptomyces sp. NPDC005648]|uniref:Rv1733c family protein n=1 Tax=Streptomyces sp. NPDC005648 TaxID=3157044 RepID=UPI0033B60689
MTTVRHGRPAGRRWWRLRPNPLRRRSYVVEAWLLLATWVLALTAAVAGGVYIAGAVERDVDALRATRHTAQAVLTGNAVRTTYSVDGTAQAWAGVRWTAADGTSHTGVARVAADSRAGGTVRIWVDGKNRLVPAPGSAEQADLQGAVVGVVAALTVGGLVLLAGWGACARLDRGRLDRWDEDWTRLDRQWGGTRG